MFFPFLTSFERSVIKDLGAHEAPLFLFFTLLRRKHSLNTLTFIDKCVKLMVVSLCKSFFYVEKIFLIYTISVWRCER